MAKKVAKAPSRPPSQLGRVGRLQTRPVPKVTKGRGKTGAPR